MRTLFLWLRVVAIAGLCGLLPASASAQAPAWQTAVAFETPQGSQSRINATAVDATGNVYVAGNFNGTLSIGTTTLNSAGRGDGFVAKWSPAIGFVWVQQVGGTGEDGANDLVVSGSSVYVVGYFASPTLAVGNTTLPNAGFYDGFVAKLVDGGNSSAWTWAQQVGGTGFENAHSLAISGSSVYVAGSFNSPTLVLGATTLPNVSTGLGDTDGFVAKLVDGGSTSIWTWAQQIGGADSDGATHLAVSGSNVYVMGNFYSPNLTVGSTTLPNAGEVDVFVAKLVDGGNTSVWNWAHQIGGLRFDYPGGLAVSGSSVYVGGSFDSPTLTVGITTLPNAGISDVFVAKLVDGGNTSVWNWAHQIGGRGSDYPGGLAVSGSSVYVGGSFDGPTLALGSTTLPNSGRYDGFVAKLVDGGNTSVWTWAQQVGGGDSDRVTTLAVSGSSVYVAGGFRSRTLTVGSTTLTTAAINNAFLAALVDPLLAVPDEASMAPALAPNPASSLTTVRGVVPGGPLTVLDGRGRVVLRARADAAGAATLDVRSLAPGLYLVREDGRAGRRLVVE